MILNLWSADQVGPVKVYRGGPRGVMKIFITVACI